MGFRAQPKHYKLSFTEDELAGLEVTVRSVSIQRRLEFNRVLQAEADTPQALEDRERAVAAELAHRLVSWNLEDEDGEAVPATLDGILSQEDDLIAAIIKAWMLAITGGPARPLDDPSPPESSIPMELLE